MCTISGWKTSQDRYKPWLKTVYLKELVLWKYQYIQKYILLLSLGFCHMMVFYKSKPFGLVSVKYLMSFFTTEYKHHPDQVKNEL